MPTARPSIRANRGVVDEIVVKTVANRISVIDSPTPISAVTRGSPATRNERKVTKRTSRAIRMPTASVIVTPGTEVENRSPPSSASEPTGSSARRSSTMLVSSSRVSAETSVACPSNCRRTIAADASSVTSPDTISSNGSVTARTPSMPSIVLMLAAMSSTYGASSTRSPSAATTMNCALVPLACGNVRLSCSSPSWASVPGIENELSVPWPSSTAPAPPSPSSRSHAISTRHP